MKISSQFDSTPPTISFTSVNVGFTMFVLNISDFVVLCRVFYSFLKEIRKTVRPRSELRAVTFFCPAITLLFGSHVVQIAGVCSHPFLK